MGEYVSRFPLVEVQHTFYEPPALSLLVRWRTQAPTRFEFTIKAWQVITHESGSPTYRRMKRPLPPDHAGQVGAFRSTPPVLEAWQTTLDAARVLRATAILLQCPRSFRPSPTNVERIRAFIGAAERPPTLGCCGSRAASGPRRWSPSCAVTSTWSTSSTRCRPRR